MTDGALQSVLNDKAGTLPTSENNGAWTSYGYYVDGEVSNYMWYVDITEGDEKYRGVYFTSYRPYSFNVDASEGYSSQDNNGYTVGTVYWFKYEPISWTILEETDGTAFVLCDMVIDSQAYQSEYVYEFLYEEDEDAYTYYNSLNGVSNEKLSNDYSVSTIRSWLNDTFYNTAFSDLQKDIIETSR